MTTTQSIEELLPTGYTVRPFRARAGAMLTTPAWLIAGPHGDEAKCASDALVGSAIAKIEAMYAQRTAPVVVAAPVAAPAAVAPAARRTTCTDHETDNHGVCYSCGTYVRSDDAGRTIRRYNTTAR